MRYLLLVNPRAFEILKSNVRDIKAKRARAVRQHRINLVIRPMYRPVPTYIPPSIYLSGDAGWDFRLILMPK
jgi:hypothetical protein